MCVGATTASVLRWLPPLMHSLARGVAPVVVIAAIGAVARDSGRRRPTLSLILLMNLLSLNHLWYDVIEWDLLRAP